MSNNMKNEKRSLVEIIKSLKMAEIRKNVLDERQIDACKALIEAAEERILTGKEIIRFYDDVIDVSKNYYPKD